MANYTAEQMREYQNRRREELRAQLTALLGGKCVRCNACQDLQFDHIDPDTKLFEIASGLDKPRDTLLAEVAKCQLLCRSHHVEKSVEESSKRDRRQVDYAKGERHPKAKLTENQVREILSSSSSNAKLAERYGVGKSTIQAVRAGRSWKHITPELSNLEAQRPVKPSSTDIGGSNPSSGTRGLSMLNTNTR